MVHLMVWPWLMLLDNVVQFLSYEGVITAD